MKTVWQRYQRVNASDWGPIPNLTQVYLCEESERLNQTQVLSLLSSLSASNGWLEWLDEVGELDRLDLNAQPMPLSGEWVDEKGVSHRLSYQGDGWQHCYAWLDNGNGREVLMEEVRHAHRERAGRWLHYQRFWGLDDTVPGAVDSLESDRAVVPIGYRFLGIFEDS